MALVINEDQQMLQEAARNFCQKHAPLSQLRKLRDSHDETGFDRDTWRQMVELGWTGMAIPEAYGGFEFGYGGLGVVLEETGRTLTSSPLIASVLLGASLINVLASEQQKQTLLPKVVAGELLLALAIDEGPHHDPESISLQAEKDATGYKLQGEKTFVLDGHVADQLIVVARSADGDNEADELSLFLVPADAPGLEITRTWMVDSRNAANITFTDVRIPGDARLGEAEQAAALERVLDIARIGVAAEMLGSVQEAFTRTVDYLNQREQFGILIGAFQGLQHRAAHMYSEIELCKSAVRAALAALDDPGTEARDLAILASLTKAKLCEVNELVSNEAIQMHGGIGMTDEFDIGFFIKRARVAQQFLGDALFHRDRYATLQGY